MLLAFNIKSRMFLIYRSPENAGFTFKGTTLQNVVESTSKSKRLRKPEEQLKDFMGASRVGVQKIFNEIKAVEYDLTPRINEDVILLKVWS